MLCFVSASDAQLVSPRPPGPLRRFVSLRPSGRARQGWTVVQSPLAVQPSLYTPLAPTTAPPQLSATCLCLILDCGHGPRVNTAPTPSLPQRTLPPSDPVSHTSLPPSMPSLLTANFKWNAGWWWWWVVGCWKSDRVDQYSHAYHPPFCNLKLWFNILIFWYEHWTKNGYGYGNGWIWISFT